MFTCTLFLSLISYLFTLLLAPKARADDMSSSSYRLFFGNFNITSGTKTSASYNVTDTVGQTAPGQYGLANNIVKAGFQYIYPLDTFSFKISPTSINFGSLIIGSFSTASQTMEITSVGAGGYSVTVAEDHPMKFQTNGTITIPDTLCDTTCSETTAAAWSNTSKYGFGYTMTGDDVVTGFSGGTNFKQFADKSLGESPQVIMTSPHVGTKRHGVLTYKINVSASQQTGNYETAITYNAIPGY
ncbi:hypothetical protein C5B42_05085 [Candidatus Cerribacteria bacterium 'Amazon FNV 2010 28 9']|uniref:Uncharacterized protein n=1 Tax=Candidatus Cerribacteria bacterium 'Amazon FNV 2010 28 9' TaxID=2081795 RepID=A0A317JNP9_9BACT|nr:MAG: hypothetical protein C5B42_05085 [Candidatus Cerribacteria bacterium 'Amazon FNV 2010 28 9']